MPSNNESSCFENVNDFWDGHSAGLITAPGLAIKYFNQYGIWHDVEVTANFRSMGKNNTEVGFIDTMKIKTCSTNNY